jgi:PII-like signaling protein
VAEGAPVTGDWPRSLAEVETLDGDARLTVHFGERTRTHGRLVADELLDLYGRHGLRASLLLRGAQGFGAKHRLRTDRLLTLSEDLPLVAMAVDRHERIAAVADEAQRLLSGGLVAVERVRIATHGSVMPEARAAESRAGSGTESPAASDAESPAGSDAERRADPGSDVRALELTAYVGRYERVERRPAFAVVCELLYERGVSGATVLLGVDGTSHGRRRRARFFARNAHVPTVALAVGERESIEATIEDLQSLIPAGLLTLKPVQVCKRDGALLSAPRLAAVNDRGASLAGVEARPLLQRLTVVTSEAATHEGRAVHLELVRRLRAAGASGATSLRGIWGFHGAHAPHGDRLLSVRRHVPVVTVLLDTPARVERLFPIVDELTAERGLVTSELVPANIAFPTRL